MAPASPPVETSLIGAVLSRKYMLTREIGRGGMGAVYAAKPVDGGPVVAIKILHPFYLADDSVLTRFMDEGRTCMRLVHPNVLRVHECLAAEDGSPYLVMDLLEGIPLSAYTKDGGRVALHHAVPILRGMLAGLEEAHSRGIVHRDLKPGNVFLARDGAIFSVKLLDFGIAKVMDAAGGMGTKTKTGALLGTPAYMSPEQVKSAKDVDARADLWSVGVMFYEMLTGRVAFAAPTEYARLAAVISAQPPPIESIDPQLAPVVPFVLRALEKDRTRRFQTAREMSDALAALAPTGAVVHSASLSAELGVSAPPSGAVGSGRQGGPAAWSLVADRSSVASPQTLPSDGLPAPAAPRSFPKREILTAPMPISGESSTLASPNRGPSVNPPAPDVVIVPSAELAAARNRSTWPGEPQKKRGVPIPLVALLVTVALALGFTLGVLFGRSG